MKEASRKRYLLIPSIRRGNGTGHFRRVVQLYTDLSASGAPVEIFTGHGTTDSEGLFTDDELQRLSGGAADNIKFNFGGTADFFDVCIFDMRETPDELFNLYKHQSFCIGIDEGGTSRGDFDYLIDCMPNLETKTPNISSTSFLRLPARGTVKTDDGQKSVEQLRVLISFGGEDKAGLTCTLLKSLIKEKVFHPQKITAVKGPLYKGREIPGGINVLDAPGDLSERLKDYDIVFTMFGITCFEALYSGVPVILFSPSGYHRKLAARAGIPEMGLMKPDMNALKRYLSNRGVLFQAVKKYSGFRPRNLASFINELSIHESAKKCAACGARHGEVIYRSETHSFFQCAECDTVNSMYFGNEKTDYGTEYFFDDYKKQYGKTYLEDFETIKTSGTRRCRIIKKYAEEGVLLDAGCGYGPFMAAASDSGFTPRGIDISDNAIKWVRDNLGFNASATSLEELSPGQLCADKYDVVTMWYVIEHLENPASVLEKINSILRPGGVFAFATPNYNGISRMRAADRFLDSNPLDHYTIWGPSSARKLLKRHGFKVKKITCPVIHPDRFFHEGRLNRLPLPLRKILSASAVAAGKAFLLGDTFEVYAIKTKDSDNKNGK